MREDGFGSANALADLARCLNRQSILPTEFLNSLQEGSASSTLPASAPTSAVLKAAQVAYGKFLAAKAVASKLAEQNSVVSKIRAVESSQVSDLRNKQSAVDVTTKNIADNEARVPVLESQIAKADADLAQMKTAKTAADGDLAAKTIPYQVGERL